MKNLNTLLNVNKQTIKQIAMVAAVVVIPGGLFALGAFQGLKWILNRKKG